ncbi:MAG: hypothetical protein JO022_04040 [Acidobacteriaceae bacterium]|nr:hypothetical protein [Acidobacteriaceae bacterium]
MRSNLLSTALLFAAAIPALCQGVAENGAAIAGGGIGVVAGKPVSNTISNVMYDVDGAVVKPAKTSKATPAPGTKQRVSERGAITVPVAGPGYGAAETSSPSGSPATSAPRNTARAPQSGTNPATQPRTAENGEQAASTPATAPVLPDLSKIQEGMHRAQVLAVLGEPSYVVTIPEEDHLFEVFGFMSHNQWLGTIRLDNGEVVRIELPRS